MKKRKYSFINLLWNCFQPKQSVTEEQRRKVMMYILRKFQFFHISSKYFQELPKVFKAACSQLALWTTLPAEGNVLPVIFGVADNWHDKELASWTLDGVADLPLRAFQQVTCPTSSTPNCIAFSFFTTVSSNGERLRNSFLLHSSNGLVEESCSINLLIFWKFRKVFFRTNHILLIYGSKPSLTTD